MSMIIAAQECETCIHSIINDEDKARVTVYCQVKDRTYHWGQCIPCEYREAKPKIKEEMQAI